MKTKKTGTILIVGGLLLIAAALCLSGYNLYAQNRAARRAEKALLEVRARMPEPEITVRPETVPDAPEISAAPEPEEVFIPDHVLDPEMDMPTIEAQGEDYIGTLDIPALGLSLPVISQWSYPALNTAPCRYEGSAYTDDMIIVAHNFRRHFGTLHELCPGDELSFTDAAGNVFDYAVSDMETLEGTDIEGMSAGDWDLTLFTCTVGGRQRVTLRCERLES